jgi:hypothetical protein
MLTPTLQSRGQSREVEPSPQFGTVNNASVAGRAFSLELCGVSTNLHKTKPKCPLTSHNKTALNDRPWRITGQLVAAILAERRKVGFSGWGRRYSDTHSLRRARSGPQNQVQAKIDVARDECV